MIKMPVGVHRKINLIAAQIFNRCTDLIGQCWELVINNQHALRAHTDRNVAARTVEHIQLVTDPLCGDFSGFKIPLKGHRNFCQPDRRRHRWPRMRMPLGAGQGHHDHQTLP